MEVCGIKFAPLNVPLRRRLQTLAASAWFLIIYYGFIICSILAVYLIFYTSFKWIVVPYLLWVWFVDKTVAVTGGRRSHLVRSSSWWGYLKAYFPMTFHVLPGAKLDPKKNYLFSCFPHGIAPAGAFTFLVSDHSGFKESFPHHIPHVVTLGLLYSFPFVREFLLAIGGVPSTEAAIEDVLGKPGGGNVCGLFVGGIAEAFYCKPGVHRLKLKTRKGFVRLALKNGASLVPVYSFGETELFDQPNSAMARNINEIGYKWLGFPPLMLSGRGFFQYSFGILPRRHPVSVVVGEPIDVPKIEQPTREQVDEYHSKFVDKLIQLFEEQKFKYLEKPDGAKLIID
ncbi:hypothetical protein NQ318_011797 [Aromia moschata]|uniref:Acyltransferase n=1 Tax=Aromia moschata TaxID=1265417 RepID=A0AAV8Y615_9CUCU|nr:hypothetical protein NQ318_011797 [Aromia moschata]